MATQEHELMQRAKVKRRQIGEAEQELAGLESQAGQQVNKLKQLSAETSKAWEWIQENMNKFERPVYGPPIVECSVKDPRYTDAVESLIQAGDFLSITTVCKADFEKLCDQVYRHMRLADISIRCVSESLADVVGRRPAMSQEQMAQLGFDGWASDFIDGPEPVVAMLCLQARIHLTGIALNEINDSQYDMIISSPIQTFVTARSYYRINTRREYGPGATSTTTRIVVPGTVWTNQPVDLNAKRELQEKIQGWADEFEAMREESKPLKAKAEDLKIERQSTVATAVRLTFLS
jgi:structural maintenance of chromosomes protein 5